MGSRSDCITGDGLLLLLVDIQNDFCHGDGCFGRLGIVDTAAIAGAVEKLLRVTGRARSCGIKIAFTQFFADTQALPAVVAGRQKRLGIDGYCRRGHWGWEFFRISPEDGEMVFHKNCYDVFLDSGIEKYLVSNRISTIVAAGCFLDVCVDSALRTAFQKGYRVAVIEDCCPCLHRSKKEQLDFMRRFYDLTVLSAHELFAGQGL